MELKCKYCNRLCKNKQSLNSHETQCKLNTNKKDRSGPNNPMFGKPAWNKRPGTAPYHNYKLKHDLNVSIDYIENYKQEIDCCEICGRKVKLCVDHCHKTKKFRGLLCRVCNRQLGWYEKQKNKIEEYLRV